MLFGISLTTYMLLEICSYNNAELRFKIQVLNDIGQIIRAPTDMFSLWAK